MDDKWHRSEDTVSLTRTCEHRRVVVESASKSLEEVPRCLVPKAELEAVDGSFEWRFPM